MGLRVVFMGTPAFAVPSLAAVAARHDVVAVYSRPDKPAGRGRTPAAPALKRAALDMGIPVFQPASLKSPAEVEMLERLRPDVIAVAAYGLLLPDDVLALPPLGCVNVHASLLPRYRGAAPIQRAILEGGASTGVSIMRIVRELDAGPFAAQVEVPIGDSDSTSLTGRLAAVGAEALLAVLDEVQNGTVVWIAQNDADATYAPKISAEDVALTPGIPVADALRRVRASSASAPSRLSIAGKRITALAASPSDVHATAGCVVLGKDGLAIGFSDGALRLDTLKPEGRSAMDGAAFARGARLSPETQWGAWE